MPTSLRRIFGTAVEETAAALRPHLQTVLRGELLEDRLAPSLYRWTGKEDTNWTNSINWEVNTAPGVWAGVFDGYPGLGTTDDKVTFDAKAIRNCNLNRPTTSLAGFWMSSDFNPRFVTVHPGAYLQVGHLNPETNLVDGYFNVSGGTLEVLGTGIVELENCDGEWWGGSINNLRDARPDTSPGLLHVGSKAKMNIKVHATDLGVNLGIGGGEFQSTVTIDNMNQNLQLWHGASITVYADGILRLNQGNDLVGDSANKGGIVKHPDSAASVITNHGTLERTGTDAPLKVAPRVTNTGLFKMAKGSAIGFWSGFHNNGGTVDIKEGTVYLPPFQKLTQTAGVIQLRGDGPLARCLFDGEVEVLGGDLFVGENQTPDVASNKFVKMEVTGDLTLGGDSHTYLGLSIRTAGEADTIAVGGTATLDAAALTITLVNNDPGYWTMINRSWDLLTATTIDGYGWSPNPNIVGNVYAFAIQNLTSTYYRVSFWRPY